MQLLPCAIAAPAAYPVVTLDTHDIEHRMRAKLALSKCNAPEEGEVPKNAKVYLILSRGLEKNNGTRTPAP
uniref:Uncharacterized protein n=1 Tax=Oryza rufipogon TaxID=4529 RepID=A0A0E0RFM5_ORYRU